MTEKELNVEARIRRDDLESLAYESADGGAVGAIYAFLAEEFEDFANKAENSPITSNSAVARIGAEHIRRQVVAAARQRADNYRRLTKVNPDRRF